MARRKPNYSEGTLFLVPLRDGGFARGVVARLDGEGRIFAYFFGPKLDRREDASSFGIVPARAILRGKCGDLGLLKGEWPIVGGIENWSRASWSMPAFFRADDAAGKAWLSRYDDDTLELVHEEQVDPRFRDDYPYDRLMGYGAAEIRLTDLLR